MELLARGMLSPPQPVGLWRGQACGECRARVVGGGVKTSGQERDDFVHSRKKPEGKTYYVWQRER